MAFKSNRIKNNLFPCFLGESVCLALPNQQFDYVATGGMAPCFGEPPLPSTLPIPGADDELFSPSMLNGDLSPNCCPNEMSPTFEKRYMREMEKTIEGSRFIAQHVRNKDKFESVSEFHFLFFSSLILSVFV